MIVIPEKFRALILAVILMCLGGTAIFALDVLDIGTQDVSDCCATGFDAAPHETTPQP